MRKGLTRFYLFTIFLLLSQYSFAQVKESAGSSTLTTIMMLIVVLIAFAVIIQVADNMIRIEARKTGVDTNKSNFSIFPQFNELFAVKKPGYVGNDDYHILKKGYDIKLEGQPAAEIDSPLVTTYALQPPNFRGLAPIPKVEVEVGDSVKAGDHLFFDKKIPEIKYVAPVSGEIIAVNRGARRSIAEIVILADKKQQYRKLPALDPATASREELVTYLLDVGAWPLIRQRPYNIIPGIHDIPDNIFISTFDTAPLAPDLNLAVAGKGEAFQKGLEVLGQLTKGKVHLGLNANQDAVPSAVYTGATGVEKHWFSGKHPTGNVGIQIHHVSPVTPKSIAWTLGVQEVVMLGALFSEGRYNAERVVALSGAELKGPKHVRTYIGANIKEMLKGNLSSEHVRFLSGDVLSGERKSKEGFLNFFDDQITVVEEGDYYEIFGWLVPGKLTPTVSKTFPNFLFPNAQYKADTNTHGEKRAFVVTGQYEDVLPMDIYPQHLMKAVLTNDYEKMEGLGIHELVEEDVALCEFVCTSKQPLQQILRTGLDMMHEQG